MLSRKLESLLQTFTQLEWQGFKKYLSAAFINENEHLINLINILHHSFSKQSNGTPANYTLTKKETWKKLFGSKPYEDLKLRRLTSDLTQHVLDYLGYKEFKNDVIANQVFRLRAINTPRLTKHFRGVLRQTRNLLEKGEYRSGDFFLNQHFVEKQCHELLEQSEDKKNDLSNLKNADYFLDSFYITNKLKHFCDILGYKKSLSLETDIPMIPGFLEYIQTSPYLKEPIIQAYFLVVEMHVAEDKDSYYFKLKNYMNDYGDQIELKELKNLYVHLINYCIDVKINNGFSEFYMELFEVYKSILNKRIIFEDQILPPHHYKNIINLGLNLKEVNWVEQFIKDYTEYLPKADQANALTYNLAEVHYHKKEYHKVLELLQEVEYQDLVYALGSKILLLRTYFESDEWLALDSLLESFRIYLRRNKFISKDVKQNYLNFNRFLKKLSTLYPGNKKELTSLKEQIVNCKKVAMKKWLLEKVEEILD